jgi:polyhydroxyalkanoate synthesis regulator phasin
MQMKKSLLVAGAVTTLGLATIGGVSAFAMGGGWHGGSNESGLATRIAQRFNLNQADVQAVFNEHDRAEREEKISAHLQKLVDKGKITSEQKTLIENKLKELASAHDQEQAEVEAWAKTQGVEAEIVIKASHKDNSSRWLQTLVDDGEITAEQKTAIEAKANELHIKHENERSALKQWAKDNNIDLKYLKIHGEWGKGHHKQAH